MNALEVLLQSVYNLKSWKNPRNIVIIPTFLCICNVFKGVFPNKYHDLCADWGVLCPWYYLVVADRREASGQSQTYHRIGGSGSDLKYSQYSDRNPKIQTSLSLRKSKYFRVILVVM